MLKYAAQCSCQTQNAIHCLRDMCNFCPFRQTQNDICRWVCKGGLISENFTIWARIVKKKVPNHSSEHYSPKGKMLRIVSGEYYLGDLSQSKKKNFLRLSHLYLYSVDAIEIFFVNSHQNGATSWIPRDLPKNVKILITFTTGLYLKHPSFTENFHAPVKTEKIL